MGKLAPVNPRNYMPSRAHPEHRTRRKELEKEHPFTWKEPLVLGMIGIGLAWNIENQVRKHEERKERGEPQGRDNNDRRRRRRDQQQDRDASYDRSDRSGESRRRSRSTRGSEDRWSSSRHRSGGGGGGGGGSDHSVGRDTAEIARSRRDRHNRVQSVDTRRHEDPRYINDDEYYEQSRYDRGYHDEVLREWDRDRESRARRSRRDSW
ncbi:hypothetical protein F5Y11DRAFT_311402 [Daldinia sp. FL1419]|nr:hypothetical protein F5Y11DRAFT_311402 [Daldinia sp. FL1419]